MAHMAPMMYMAPSPEIHTKTFNVGDPVMYVLALQGSSSIQALLNLA
ncbi:hypothetical protein MY10362_000811 [Beauveria mimosiformis]